MARRLQLPSGQSGAVVTDVDPDGAVGRRAAQRRRDPLGQRQAGVERRGSGARAAEGRSRAASRSILVWRGDGEVFVHGQEGMSLADCRLQIADCSDLLIVASVNAARSRWPRSWISRSTIPTFGYYARAAQRSGRAGDFFTSVDVGPLFGELLEVQIAEMAAILRLADSQTSALSISSKPAPATAGCRPTSCARRSARHPAFYDAIRLHLVEASAAARARAARRRSATSRDRLASSGATLPDSFEGVLIANELLDALPVHQVVMREDGLREVYVERGSTTAATLDARVEGPPSTPALAEYLDRARRHARARLARRDQPARGRLDPRRGAAAAPRLHHPDRLRPRRARAVLGHALGRHADDVRAAHAAADRRRRRHAAVAAAARANRIITAHVDFTSVRAAAEAEGMTTLGFLDQTYFLLGLRRAAGPRPRWPQRRAARSKTLMMPGGLGSTHKVLILGKGVGTPALRGCRSGCASRDEPAIVMHGWARCDHGRRPRPRRSRRSSRSGRGTRRSAWTGFILFADGDRLARARRLVDPHRRRASSCCWRSRRFRCGSSSSSTTSSSETGTTSACPRTPCAAVCSATPGRSRRSGRRSSRARSWSRCMRAGRAGTAGAAQNGSPPRARPAADPPYRRPVRSPPARSCWRRRSSSRHVARYLAAPVWLGFIFLLDPINARLGGESARLARRTRDRSTWCSSGLLCGVLWEFWNYWSRAKWHYTVPIMEHLKIFEMPVPGYLGFPAFALECFTMYVSSCAVGVFTPVARHAADRAVIRSRARADRRSRHAPASADRRPRQAGDPGRRRADDPAHHQRGSSRTASTDLVLNLHHRPETLTAVVGDGRDLGGARALFVGAAAHARQRRRPAPGAAARRRRHVPRSSTATR